MKLFQLFQLFQKIKVKEEIKLNIPDTLTAAMRILEKENIYITQIQVSEELAKEMINGRHKIDMIGPSKLLMEIDTTYCGFLSKDKLRKEVLKKKSKDFIGMMFGIDICKT